MTNDKLPPNETHIEANEPPVSVYKYWDNTAQEVIRTTKDRLELCLTKHLKRAEQKWGWITPLGILLTIVISIVTCDFKKFGLDAETWKALFIIVAILAFVCLIYKLFQVRRSVKIEDIIDELKKDSPVKPK